MSDPVAQRALPGILGGLGPAAHIEFERRLLDESTRRGARSDGEHPEWMLVGASRTPDRTRELLGLESGCARALGVAVERLQAAGAEFVVAPCNTSHAFRAAVEELVPLPWLDLIEVTCETIARTFPQGGPVAVLQTTGTALCALYKKRLPAYGFEPVCAPLDSPLQRGIMDAIYDKHWGLKATGSRVSRRASAVLHAAMEDAEHAHALCIVPGCTELSVAFSRLPHALPVVDPLDCAARATLDVAYGLRPLPSLGSASVGFPTFVAH